MNTIGTKINRIVEAARQGQPLAYEWKREEIGSGWSFFSERLRAKLGLSGALNLNDTQIAVEIFDKIEEFPIFKESIVQGIEKNQLTAMISLGESMLASLRSVGDPMAYQLARRLVALRYRLSLSSEVGLSREDQRPLPMNLYELASAWKSSQSHFDNNILSSEDHRLLRNLASYPHFFPLLENDQKMRDDFFNWVIRDHLDPAIFIEFPAIQEKITQSNLQIRLGRHGGRDLKIVRDQVTEVTIPIEGKPQNIINPLSTITLRGNYTLNVSDVFEIFKNKNLKVGNLEFMSEGIVNWESFKLGYWNNDLGTHVSIDLNQPNWWEQMPRFETLSSRQLASRYNIDIPANKWIVAFHGTRQELNLNFDKTHAFLEIAIPRDDGYAVYGIGKYGTEFPASFFEELSSFCDVMPGAIAFPDENVYYSQRQHAYYPIVLSASQGQQLMDRIANDIRAAREGRLVYQIESENCAKWALETVQSIVDNDELPKLFKIPLLETEPTGFVAKAFGLIKKLPSKIQNWVLTRAHYFLGAWKGRWIKNEGVDSGSTWVSVTGFEFFKTATIYLPALLVQQVKQGIVWTLQSALRSWRVMINIISRRVHNFIRNIKAQWVANRSRSSHLLAIFLARTRVTLAVLK